MSLATFLANCESSKYVLGLAPGRGSGTRQARGKQDLNEELFAKAKWPNAIYNQYEISPEQQNYFHKIWYNGCDLIREENGCETQTLTTIGRSVTSLKRLLQMRGWGEWQLLPSEHPPLWLLSQQATGRNRNSFVCSSLRSSPHLHNSESPRQFRACHGLSYQKDHLERTL